MRRKDLELRIHDWIKSFYKAEYIGLLTVTQDGTSYLFTLGVPSYMAPTTIGFDTDSDQQFLAFIYEELRTRNYMRLEIYKVKRLNTNDSREE